MNKVEKKNGVRKVLLYRVGKKTGKFFPKPWTETIMKEGMKASKRRKIQHLQRP